VLQPLLGCASQRRRRYGAVVCAVTRPARRRKQSAAYRGHRRWVAAAGGVTVHKDSTSTTVPANYSCRPNGLCGTIKAVGKSFGPGPELAMIVGSRAYGVGGPVVLLCGGALDRRHPLTRGDGSKLTILGGGLLADDSAELASLRAGEGSWCAFGFSGGQFSDLIVASMDSGSGYYVDPVRKPQSHL
jgi:hypothetical protein